MESINISGLRIQAHHGVMEQERRIGNEFVVDIRLDLADASLAMTSDSLDNTVNYAEVVEIVKQEMAIPSHLLEHVAYRIRKAIIDRFGLQLLGGLVSVAKLAPPISAQLDSVAFTIAW